MDHFKTKILEEFNADLYRVLNLTMGDYRRMFAQHGENIDDNINKVFAEDGPSGLRRYLKGCVGGLDYLLTKTAQEGEAWMDQEHDNEEMWTHIESLKLGIDRHGLTSA